MKKQLYNFITKSDWRWNASDNNERRTVLLVCCLIPFSAMNIAMFNVALPDIVADFQVRFGAASWVVTVFGILYAVGALVYGKLADRIGIRRLAVFGIAVFALGSIAGLFAFRFGMLMAGRILQGIGASAIPSLSMLVPVRFVHTDRRGRAMGMVAATLALSGALGPVVGGWIVGTFHWRYLFLFSLGALAVLPFLLRWMPDDRQPNPQPIDSIGAATFIAAVVGVMLAVTLFSPWPLLAGLCVLPVFWLRQQRAAAPFIPLNLLRSGPYRHGLGMGALNAAMNFGVMLLTPILLREVYGLDADRIGLLLFPGAVVSSAIGYFGGKIIDQRGSRAVLTMGVMSTGAGLMLLSSLSGYPVWGIALCLVLTNAGYMLMQPALAKWVSGTLAKGETGIGMGVYSLNNFLSTAMTGAVAAKALEHVGPVAVNPLAVSGMSGVYSNVYFGFFVLALLQGGLVYRMRFSRPDVQPAPMPSDRDPAFHERHSRPQK